MTRSPSERDAALLWEMKRALEDVASFVARTDREAFEHDRLVFNAVCMSLLVVGECASKLSEPFRRSLPDTPWPTIIALRHRIAHGYDSLSPARVWTIATVDAPELQARLPEPRLDD